MPEQKDNLGFLQLLESGALELRNKGSFTTEFSPKDLEQMMRQVVAQSEEEMKKRGVTARIDKLNVQIANGKGKVETGITASKKVGFMNPKVGITAKFELENVVDDTIQPTGRLKTTDLEVAPETLFMVVKPKDFLAPRVEGEKINDTFRTVLDGAMQLRGARISGLKLAFTPENRLRIEVQGGKK